MKKILATLAMVLGLVSTGEAQSSPVSGLMFPQYRYTFDNTTKTANGGNATNKFDVERVYLNFLSTAGENGSIRITTDIFNNSISNTSCVGCYAGWNVRLKYAFFQYNILHNIGGSKGFDASVKFGMLQTVLIDHEEQFWPRYMSMAAVERNSFFASSDLGVAGTLTLPKKFGEVYATVTNGTGYSSVEADPYKDYALRVSVTPFGFAGDGLLKTFTVSPYVYYGHTASKFLTTTGSDTTSASRGLAKNRNGVFVGLKDRRLTAGVDWARKLDGGETGTNLATRKVYNNTGILTSEFVIVRPIEILRNDPKIRSPFGVVGRLDNLKLFSNTVAAGTQTINAANQTFIGGVFCDLNSRATISLDYQHVTPKNGSTTVESKILFTHMVITF